MTIHTVTRITDHDIPGFDYEATPVSRYFWAVTHAGKYVGRLAAGDGFWTAMAAVTFGDRENGTDAIGTADTMGEAVALIHAHWAALSV